MAAEIDGTSDAVAEAAYASMRPRRMAAEIDGDGDGRNRHGRRFNEAAANGRGNRTSPTTPAKRRPRRFNEAAANGRGNPARRSRRLRGCPSLQ